MMKTLANLMSMRSPSVYKYIVSLSIDRIQSLSVDLILGFRIAGFILQQSIHDFI